MLTTVTLTADLRPWRKGDDIHISPALAAHLVQNGEAQNPRPFVSPNAPVAPVRVQGAPQRSVLHLHRKRK